MSAEPYRGTVEVIPYVYPERFVEHIALGIIWLINWFVVGLLFS